MNKSLPLLLIVLLFLAGCRESARVTTPEANPNIQIDLEIAPDPAEVGESTLVITLRDADGSPIENASVAVRGDMSHAGMQPVLREADDASTDAPGVYRFPFEWTMGGDWFVVVTATLPDGTEAIERFELSVES
ncbi:MAG: hypothetical protein OHK0046_23340 [Anaerolineae bacterium]